MMKMKTAQFQAIDDEDNKGSEFSDNCQESVEQLHVDNKYSLEDEDEVSSIASQLKNKQI